MTATAFWLIILSVLLHVSWNLMSKVQRPTLAFYIILAMDATIVLLPFLYLAQVQWAQLPHKFWLFTAGSILSNILYYWGLFKTYSREDISLAYPMVRSLPILFTAAITLSLGIGKQPTLLSLAGMFTVFCGCTIMPIESFSKFRLKDYLSPSLITIALTALGTSGYTIFDSLSIPLINKCAAGHPICVSSAYNCLLECGILVGLSLPLCKNALERGNFKRLLFHSPLPHLSGIFTDAAYILVLLAMPMVTNVMYVQCFRQMGLPLGVIAGALILKEKCTVPRILGMVIIVLGLIVAAIP